MYALSVSNSNMVRILISLLLFTTANSIRAQELPYTYFYRIYLRDKGENPDGKYSARDLLSQRAIDRRNKAGIKVPDYRDFPVNNDYLNQISLLGLKLHSVSKWMNTALFKSQTGIEINTLLTLPFVANVKTVKTPGVKSHFTDKLNFKTIQGELPAYDRPLTMVNGSRMHLSGYDGSNMLIAILDGGFSNAGEISSLNGLRARKGIIATYDFVTKSKSVFNSSSHGTAVLSVLAGQITDKLEGTAPGADYLLLLTEDVNSEFPCEEDFWAAGAEFADSTGADIISSSLGYFNFDDPAMNYKNSELDGNSAFITNVADIAASKGILVVSSAGNERAGSWEQIIFPADGDSVLAVGAVDGSDTIAGFSSAGFSADGRIKPDNVAMGVDMPVQVTGISVVRASGTSFSCPVLSGMAACLMQAVPKALNSDIIYVLHSTGDRYSNPDSLYGYGIPDIDLALNNLQDKYLKIPERKLLLYPNPTSGSFEIIFPEPPRDISIELISEAGKLILRKNIRNYAGRSVIINDLQNMGAGIYLLRITGSSGLMTGKVIKLRS